VEDNCLIGPGLAIDTGDNDIGLSTSWLCENAIRQVSVKNNRVDGWKKLGIYLYRPKSDTLSLNLITDCRNGIDVVSTGVLSGAMHFRENRIEAFQQDSTYFCLRTDDAANTKLGPKSNSSRGLNQFAVYNADTKFIYEGDSGLLDQLNAINNFWFTYNGSNLTQWYQRGDFAQITSRLAPLGYAIVFDPPESTSAPNPYLGCESASGTNPVRLENLVTETAPPFDDGGSLPIEFSMGIARPNPGYKQTSLDLAVPASHLGTFQLAVFDIRGRRLFETDTRINHPGHHVLQWSGEDSRGNELSSGIYFLKVWGPGGIDETRKVILLR
jgi:hypothetical protein